MRRVRRLAAWGLLVMLTLAVGTGWWARRELRGSLPRVDGRFTIAGLSAPVTVTRDELGIPSISGRSRADVARATGFVHAQDRFFQMDLSRRRAAGELSSLVGSRALPLDREIRIHRFRDQARRAVALLPPSQRQVLSAYVAGVNAGLSSLSARPFEYLLLRQAPQPWRDEDSFLVVLSMFVTLQESNGEFETTLATMHDTLPPALFEFLVPRGTEWDAPIVGERLPAAPIPGPDVYDLRTKRTGTPTAPRRPRPIGVAWLDEGRGNEALGSNNWAVAGRLTADGRALVANDMHLGIRVPNTWYRALLQWQASDGPRSLVGVTLPGVPALVVGSNTNVAWGFTNTYADTSDVVLVETDAAHPGEYKTPDGWKRFQVFRETLDVAGGPAESLTVTWTIWGPLLPPDFRGRLRAYRWVAHSAERLAAGVTPLEDARTVSEALDAASTVGAPAQNIVVADRSGQIGWGIYGTLPSREGVAGRLPSSWSGAGVGWPSLLATADYPREVAPDSGRLWTANARVVDGSRLATLGDGNWEVGSRATIIRERLFAKERFAANDLLAIQMDARGEFLERWRQLILDTLNPSVSAGSSGRQAFRDVVEHGWNGEASPDSSAYRLTRMFRDAVSERTFAFVLVDCYESDPTFDYSVVRRREGPLWALVTARPQHLLDPAFATWSDLLIASIDEIVARFEREGGGDLRSRTWSQMNTTGYRHPLSAAVPLLSRWLDMPAQELAGDLYTPQVHWGTIAASERMVVSPGHEDEGIMHMPTGQSGHPLSPFYANSHQAWVEGRPTPLLPGVTTHTLVLAP